MQRGGTRRPFRRRGRRAEAAPRQAERRGTSASHKCAFEVDLPNIELSCQVFISNPAYPNPGAGCVNPPAGAEFYPLFTTRGGEGSCTWQFGGANIPGTKQTFGGSSTAEYGPLLEQGVPTPTGITLLYLQFRQVLSSNPCPSRGNIASLD